MVQWRILIQINLKIFTNQKMNNLVCYLSMWKIISFIKHFNKLPSSISTIIEMIRVKLLVWKNKAGLRKLLRQYFSRLIELFLISKQASKRRLMMNLIFLWHSSLIHFYWKIKIRLWQFKKMLENCDSREKNIPMHWRCYKNLEKKMLTCLKCFILQSISWNIKRIVWKVKIKYKTQQYSQY